MVTINSRVLNIGYVQFPLFFGVFDQLMDFTVLDIQRGQKGVKPEDHFTGIGIVFAVGYTLGEIGMMGYFPVESLFWANLYVIVTFFGTPVLVFFILEHYLNLYYASRPVPREQTGIDFTSFFETYGISQREGEIIRLILKGHSNREIEEELFISLETVKKHIYNIYKKTRVKNRLRLNALIRNFTGGKR